MTLMVSISGLATSTVADRINGTWGTPQILAAEVERILLLVVVGSSRRLTTVKWCRGQRGVRHDGALGAQREPDAQRHVRGIGGPAVPSEAEARVSARRKVTVGCDGLPHLRARRAKRR